MLKHSIDHTLIAEFKANPGFTSDDLTEIGRRIEDFQLHGAKSREGGSALQKHLSIIENAQESISQHLDSIRAILAPSATRGKQAIVTATQNDAIEKVTRSFNHFNSDPDLLILFAIQMLGGQDKVDEYLLEELPRAIAYKQVTGEYLKVD